MQVAPASGPLEVYQYIVAADDGRVLRRHDLSAYEAFQYRVPADADGDHRPFDGPLADFTPHPTGVPGQGPKGVNPPALVATEGFNTNPDAVADPWLAPGATETVGNNVDAYVDHKTPNGLDIDLGDFRATVTAPGVFDRTYDVGLEPLSSQNQSMAAITSCCPRSRPSRPSWPRSRSASTRPSPSTSRTRSSCASTPRAAASSASRPSFAPTSTPTSRRRARPSTRSRPRCPSGPPVAPRRRCGRASPRPRDTCGTAPTSAARATPGSSRRPSPCRTPTR